MGVLDISGLHRKEGPPELTAQVRTAAIREEMSDTQGQQARPAFVPFPKSNQLPTQSERTPDGRDGECASWPLRAARSLATAPRIGSFEPLGCCRAPAK